MSYQEIREVALVVCDGCGARGAVGDRDWRQMRRTSAGAAAHLCPSCRRSAIWCEAHQRYHRPGDSHRCACADCGGLYTTTIDSGIARCPSCQRAHTPARPAADPPHHSRERIIDRLRAFLAAAHS
jgi:hypothetical protein